MQTVVKRNGKTDQFNPEKIRQAMIKAFVAVEGESAKLSTRIHVIVDRFIEELSHDVSNLESIHIETIQDRVERALMIHGEQKVARSYVIYREERAKERASQNEPFVIISLESGKNAKMTHLGLEAMLQDACKNLPNVSAQKIAIETLRNLYAGVTLSEIKEALRITTRTLIEQEPDYSFVAARLLTEDLRNETRCVMGLEHGVSYADDLRAAIAFGVQHEQLNPILLSDCFDLDFLGNGLVAERDGQFTYLGIQTLYDRYFLHVDGGRYERPQTFFMRVAMGLSINEANPNASAKSFYELLSSFDYMASTPTLFNAGTLRPQLSSCYLTTVPDDLSGIYHAIHDNAMLSKFAGGLGNDWTPVRSLGAYIKGTNGKSQGVVPFLKVVNDTAVAVNQGGKRKGAVCAYLETWHMDIEEFLELRKNTGDDRRRTHDMNTANWTPDLFMKRVFEGGDWTLFSPSDVPDLHDLTGSSFERRYEQYEAMAMAGEIRLSKKIKAGDLWRKMLSMLFETGHPWITFKDPCNLRSPQQHVGVVHSSNLCTEITLNTSKDEIAVCNLGSVNLPQHIVNGRIDAEKLKRTVTTAMRMLDNVIDINLYVVETAKNSNLRHRPVGMGMMGFQDALYEMKLAYASQEAVDFADISMELISYYAIEASHELAIERGSYSSFEGSLWSQGILPIDSIAILARERGQQYLDMDTSSTLDWASLRAKSSKAMRNSNTMAIAPTATISNICGVTQSIEPTYQNLYVKSNLSGEFTVINPHLVRDLKALGLWDAAMVNDLKYFDGSVQQIERVPAHLRAIYATAFEVEARWLIDAASRRQKWLDQAQSLNLYIAGASGKKLDLTYRMAWIKGLKTTYYLRALAATGTEKSTISTGQLNAVSAG
jgi:ribonucleoside-diphosphate reductase alpha chain